MNIAVILAGGIGARLGYDLPKQYISVGGKPIISYSMTAFDKHKLIDGLIVVASNEWRGLIDQCVEMEEITKFLGYADAGESRQHSVYNGLKKACTFTGNDYDIVLVHDAARPNVDEQIITECISALDDADGVVPVITIKDTVYYSQDGKQISGLVRREELFAGQTPEGFRLKKYLALHERMPYDQIGSVTGSCQIAYNHGFKVKLVKGAENNYKITTQEDLEKFAMQLKN